MEQGTYVYNITYAIYVALHSMQSCDYQTSWKYIGVSAAYTIMFYMLCLPPRKLFYNVCTCAITCNIPLIHNRPSSRGVLTYGLGTLYLTTVSSRNQSVHVFPADFASIDKKFILAFGVIPHRDVVRDVTVVSDMLQPLPGTQH